MVQPMIRRTLRIVTGMLVILAVLIGRPIAAEALYLDPHTGLQWNVIQNGIGFWSVNSLLAQTGPGGVFEGFRYATAPEIEALFVSFGILPENSDVANWGPVHELTQSVVGLSGESPGAKWFNGVTGTPSPDRPGAHLVARVITGKEFHSCMPPNCGADAYVYTSGGWADDFTPLSYSASMGTGHWLVMDAAAPVPEPASLMLLASGLAGLATNRRRLTAQVKG